jgi:hypothetical protein
MLLQRLKNIRFCSRFYLLGLLFLLNACADIKKALVHEYPKQTAFVYDNKIILKGAENKKILHQLNAELSNYWDDSIKAKRIRQFGIFSTLVNPTKFQADKVDHTIHYMQSYLATRGYHHPQLTPIIKNDTVRDEWRVRLTMEVQLNKKTIIDTVTYVLNDPILQKIAKANSQAAYIKKGSAYSNESINNELDRLVELFRSNGYYYFTKEKIFAEVDTIDQALMQLNLDPLGQMEQVKKVGKKEDENPSWKVSFQLRNTNNNNTKQYPIGQQIFYSDLALTDNPDSILVQGLVNKEATSLVVHQFNKPKFKTHLFEEQSIIRKGDLFNESMFYQTLNNFSSLGAWQQIDARTSLQHDSVYLHYFLLPALRHSYSIDLEGSRNTAQLGAGNLLGLSTNFTYRDRNVQKKSIPSVTSLRTGIELNINNDGQDLTQTLLWNVSHSYSFPNLLIPFVPKKQSYRQNVRSNFSLNNSYIDRLNYYQLKSFTTNWGYEWKETKKGSEHIWIYKPINIELYQLKKFGKLDSLLISNPFLRSSFNEGNVISQTVNFIHAGPSKQNARNNNYFRIGMEEAGGLLGMSTNLQDQIYRYLKLELEFRKLYKFDYTEFAFRFMGGWGNNYSNNAKLGGQLPFFKQFTAGGPYSMRAWGLRQLGLGSSTFYDTTSTSQNFDRFGDIQLETNFEYRFPLFQFGSYKMGSALFTDIGNIWNSRSTEQDPAAAFKLDKLYKDLAIGVGTGLRFDFNYFIVRIDYAIKLKDPTRTTNEGWLDIQKMKWSEIKQNGLKVNNYAWQFGIGLPF